MVEGGLLCIAPIKLGSTPGKGASTIGREDEAAAAITASLSGPVTVSLDGEAAATIDAETGAVVSGIDGTPMLSVRGADGRALASFPLRFDDSDARCLRYGSFYNSWMLSSLDRSCGPCRAR